MPAIKCIYPLDEPEPPRGAVLELGGRELLALLQPCPIAPHLHHLLLVRLAPPPPANLLHARPPVAAQPRQLELLSRVHELGRQRAAHRVHRAARVPPRLRLLAAAELEREPVARSDVTAGGLIGGVAKDLAQRAAAHPRAILAERVAEPFHAVPSPEARIVDAVEPGDARPLPLALGQQHTHTHTHWVA